MVALKAKLARRDPTGSALSIPAGPSGQARHTRPDTFGNSQPRVAVLSGPAEKPSRGKRDDDVLDFGVGKLPPLRSEI